MFRKLVIVAALAAAVVAPAFWYLTIPATIPAHDVSHWRLLVLPRGA
jgi:hypothetical protein